MKALSKFFEETPLLNDMNSISVFLELVVGCKALYCVLNDLCIPLLVYLNSLCEKTYSYSKLPILSTFCICDTFLFIYFV